MLKNLAFYAHHLNACDCRLAACPVLSLHLLLHLALQGGECLPNGEAIPMTSGSSSVQTCEVVPQSAASLILEVRSLAKNCEGAGDCNTIGL